MKYDFFIVHVLALVLLIFKVPFTLFSNMVTAAENQGITLNILNQNTFISSSFRTVYFNRLFKNLPDIEVITRSRSPNTHF